MSRRRGADLHTHSHYSDGTCAPAEVVALAVQLQLEAVALTDHDTVAGLAEAESEARRLGITFIPGIELSADHSGAERHLLGYWVDPDSQPLAELLAEMVEDRRRRVGRIRERLQACGVDLPVEAVLAVCHHGVLGRMHVAEALCQRGVTSTLQEAFDRFLRDNGPAYVPKHALAVEETIALIHQAGGVAVLAHPGETPGAEEIASFARAGLDGLEALYPGYAPSLSEYYAGLAQDLRLVATGGSDFHGERKLQWLGSVTVPLEAVERLRQRVPAAPAIGTVPTMGGAAGTRNPASTLPAAAAKDRQGEGGDGPSGAAPEVS